MTGENKLGASAGNRGKGRPKGSKNKTTLLLREAILKAAEDAGGSGGLVGYLTLQATESPSAFLALLGRIIPTQVEGPGENGEHFISDVTPAAKLEARLNAIASRTISAPE